MLHLNSLKIFVTAFSYIPTNYTISTIVDLGEFPKTARVVIVTCFSISKRLKKIEKIMRLKLISLTFM